MKVFARLLLAISCVTALPLANRHHEPFAMHGLAKYLPTVGLFIGLLLVALSSAMHALAVSSLGQGVLLTLAWIGITGAIHLDGLMDTADGLFSHRSPERMLEIMRDSRVGNFGALSGLALVLVKTAALAGLRYPNLLCTLLLLPIWARWCETFTIGFFGYARDEGLGKIWHDTTKYPRDLLIALAMPAAATAVCGLMFGWLTAVWISLSAVIGGLLSAFYINRILEGQTGDTYGAVVELSEASGLLFLLVFRVC